MYYKCICIVTQNICMVNRVYRNNIWAENSIWLEMLEKTLLNMFQDTYGAIFSLQFATKSCKETDMNSAGQESKKMCQTSNNNEKGLLISKQVRLETEKVDEKNSREKYIQKGEIFGDGEKIRRKNRERERERKEKKKRKKDFFPERNLFLS